MNTWLYPGWTQGSDNGKIREESECNDRSVDTDTERFPEDYDTEPPVPVESSETVANFVADDDAIPDDLVADEHVAKVGDLTVMRAGVECPQCGSEVFLHPESVLPNNSVCCYNCSYSPLRYVWWETPRLGTFASGGESA